MTRYTKKRKVYPLGRAAMRSSGLRTKRTLVQAALRLLVEIQGQTGIRKLRGKVQWEGDLDALWIDCHAE